MKGHETRVTVDGKVQRRDIAITHERFGIGANQLEVQPVEQARCAVAATQAEDGIDLRIGKSRVQVAQAHVITAGQVAVALIHTREYPQFVATGAHPLPGFFNIQCGRAGRGDQADHTFGTQNRHRRRELSRHPCSPSL